MNRSVMIACVLLVGAALCAQDASQTNSPPQNVQQVPQFQWPQFQGPQNLAICRDTLCPAVLVEGKFQDNIDDVCWLTSQKGFEATVSTYVKAALLYAKS